jgi:superfamily II DNA or RNA helicase
MVLNEGGRTVEHAIVEELSTCSSFAFSVAFITAGAIAQLKQHLLNFKGAGMIITSDFLGFNQPGAFLELLNLARLLGIEVRRHRSPGFHPKGYIFQDSRRVTAMVGSANLTNRALSQNHEWNLKVSAATGSDLALQLTDLLTQEREASEPLTREWVDAYAATYVAPVSRQRKATDAPGLNLLQPAVEPNEMQRKALLSLGLVRADGAKRAIIISATGTGKTMLSALDVRAASPARLLFVVHREQILDRTIEEYKKVLGGTDSNYGKLTGSHKQGDRRFVFATVQTLSQESVLGSFGPEDFDYIVIDEAHRAGSETHQRVISHFRPKFLLGMTATPERMDGFNVFELFDFTVPYEIRLQHALEAEMLCPFHYYGISDVTFDDGSTTSDVSQLRELVSPERVNHVIEAIDKYAQAGVAPRGLIFCTRKEEARALSVEMNSRELRGHPLRTIALTSDDSIEVREKSVADLEAGALDYVLTVDVFNEGIDIPSVNQVIMLRQTQSAIVFVQQLGRGLRLHDDKDYLVVIDFIGNYANNFLIPVALFGDESLNRESLRERMNETFTAGALPGLSSVSFDEISRERVLESVSVTKLDSFANLKAALVQMRNRVGKTPALVDFLRFESVDPVLLATKKDNYPALVAALLGAETGLLATESRALSLLSREVLAGKRLHEHLLLELLLGGEPVTHTEIERAFQLAGLQAGPIEVRTAIDTLVLRGYSAAAMARYETPIAEDDEGSVRLTVEFRESVTGSPEFSAAVNDLLETGKMLTSQRYKADRPFTPGMQYSRLDAAHILGWPRSMESTIYGVKTDPRLGVCAVFVTLEKSEEVSASTAYNDQLIDEWTMQWFSKSNRTLRSQDVAPMVAGDVKIYVFVKKDDAEGRHHHFLGEAHVVQAEDAEMLDDRGKALPVVSMVLRFTEPITQGLFDYFAPRGLAARR